MSVVFLTWRECLNEVSSADNKEYCRHFVRGALATPEVLVLLAAKEQENNLWQ